MIAYQDIRDVHLEISTLCNASCPWCPRNFWGYPFNGGYPELYLSKTDAQKIFQIDFLKQLKVIRVNGNFGDIVMNPDGADIIEYFREANPDLRIVISTNGGARNRDFWKRLAHAKVQVLFALDGLEDTHHLYRQNTVWNTVIKNAKTFIDHGGDAVWQMIVFKHNLHQVEECKRVSEAMGFSKFITVDDGRHTAPVFDQHGNLTHVLGDYQGQREFKILFHSKQTDEVLLEDVIGDRVPKSRVNCEAKNLGSIFIAANGDISPCCWTGFYPKTYGKGQYHQAANAQLVPLIAKNNALEHSIQECIQWFTEIERSWCRDTYQQGRLIICDENCGSDF